MKNYEETTVSGKVVLLYNKNGMRVFDITCAQGYFRVVDYKYNPLDREIYWARGIILLNTKSKEYEVAEALANGYIRGVHRKLKAAAKKNWPLV
jgi:hypothetical protein